MHDLFQKIISGEIPSHKLYEDENTFAFLDISPASPGHTLVVPKKQSRNFLDADDETVMNTMKTVRKVANSMKSALGAEGINIIINNEPAAGQIVFHFHVHIIPRYKGDELEHWHGKETPVDELQKIAAKIREKI